MDSRDPDLKRLFTILMLHKDHHRVRKLCDSRTCQGNGIPILKHCTAPRERHIYEEQQGTFVLNLNLYFPFVWQVVIDRPFSSTGFGSSFLLVTKEMHSKQCRISIPPNSKWVHAKLVDPFKRVTYIKFCLPRCGSRVRKRFNRLSLILLS